MVRVPVSDLRCCGMGLGKERKSPLGPDAGNALGNDPEQSAVTLKFSACAWVWVRVRQGVRGGREI